MEIYNSISGTRTEFVPSENVLNEKYQVAIRRGDRKISLQQLQLAYRVALVLDALKEDTKAVSLVPRLESLNYAVKNRLRFIKELAIRFGIELNSTIPPLEIGGPVNGYTWADCMDDWVDWTAGDLTGPVTDCGEFPY